MVQTNGTIRPPINLLGVPVQDGTHERGCLMGPDALRTAGIIETLNDLGLQCTDQGDLSPQTLELASPTQGKAINFAKIAEASGYSVSLTGNELNLIDELFSLEGHEGPVFGHLKINSGTIENLPRPDVTPNEVLTRLMSHIETTF